MPRRSGTESTPATPEKESELIIDLAPRPWSAVAVPYCCVSWPCSSISTPHKGIPARLFTSPTTNTPGDFGAQFEGYMDSNGLYHGYEIDSSMLYPSNKDGAPIGPPVTQREAIALYQASKLTASVQKSVASWVDFQRNIMGLPYNRRNGKSYRIQIDESEPSDDALEDREHFPFRWTESVGEPGADDYVDGHFVIGSMELATEALQCIGLLFPFKLDKTKGFDGLDDRGHPFKDGPFGGTQPEDYIVTNAEFAAAATREEGAMLLREREQLAVKQAPQLVFMLEVTPDSSEEEPSGYQPPRAQRKVLHKIPDAFLPRLKGFIAEYGLDTPAANAIARLPEARGPLDLLDACEDEFLFVPAYLDTKLNGTDALMKVNRTKEITGYFPVPKPAHPHHAAIDAILSSLQGRHPTTGKQARNRKGWSSLPSEQLEELQEDAKRLKYQVAHRDGMLASIREELSQLKQAAKDRDEAKVVHARDGQAIAINGTNTLVPAVSGAKLHMLDQLEGGGSMPLHADHGARIVMVAPRPNLSAFPGLYPALC